MAGFFNGVGRVPDSQDLVHQYEAFFGGRFQVLKNKKRQFLSKKKVAFWQGKTKKTHHRSISRKTSDIKKMGNSHAEQKKTLQLPSLKHLGEEGVHRSGSING